MKAKVLLYGASTVALAALLAWQLRGKDAPRAAAKIAKATTPELRDHPALSSYRVFEESATEDGLPYRGANYKARVSPDGLHFEAEGHRITLRARRIEQGGASVDLAAGPASSAGWAKATVDRGSGVSEEFVFENRRAEHLVRVQAPVGEGALTVRVAVDTNLTGPVQQVRRGDPTWKDMTLRDGGLAFTNGSGQPALAYHGAVAIDAAGRRQLFDPRWENGEIALEVPAAFMKDAAYPVLIDPWLELNFSGSGGGISLTGTVTETPAITLIGGASPAVAWSDASDGDFDIYFRYWNGESWTHLGNADANISDNDGRSTNPSIGNFTPTNTGLFHPYIAWEDDEEGTTNIYARFWTGTTWAELGDSAQSSGVSLSIGVPCRNPQALSVEGLVDNLQIITTPPTLNQQPDRQETFPCIVWEREGVGIECRFFYPGDNRNPGAPARWYAHPAGRFLSASASASRPSAVVTSSNQVAVAWEESAGGEFDILAAVHSPPGGLYSIDMTSGTPSPTVLILGAPQSSSWAAIGSGNVNADAGVAAGGLSIQPSLAVDALDDLWVAWQEAVGTEREIYVARSSGFGGWTGVAGSASAGGVSSTSVVGATTTSAFPSIAVDPFGSPARPAVAWEDDAGGNHEIYVRRLDVAGTSWAQIADEGSAMLVAPEVTGNTGGVSRTPSFSLRPRLLVAPGGGISVAWRDGASGQFDLFLRRYHDNTPSDLQQSAVTAVVTPVSAGGTSGSTTVQFSAVLLAESSALAPLRLQVEVRPNGSSFTGQPTHESSEIVSGGTATILFTGLPNVNYHWRARSLDSFGRGSPWLSFGNNADGDIDLRIASSNAGAGGPNVVGSTESKDKCGLTGLEALAFVALAAVLRRRRRTA